MDLTDVVAVFAIVAPIVWKVVDFAKFIINHQINAAVTQAIVWGVGTATIFLLAGTDFASAIGVGGTNLANLNAASLLFIGLAGGSVASAAYDYKQARDNKDNASTPALLGGESVTGKHAA